MPRKMGDENTTDKTKEEQEVYQNNSTSRLFTTNFARQWQEKHESKLRLIKINRMYNELLKSLISFQTNAAGKNYHSMNSIETGNRVQKREDNNYIKELIKVFNLIQQFINYNQTASEFKNIDLDSLIKIIDQLSSIADASFSSSLKPIDEFIEQSIILVLMRFHVEQIINSPIKQNELEKALEAIRQEVNVGTQERSKKTIGLGL